MTDVALFGAGRIGKIHAGNLVRQPGVKLKYVVDVNAAAAAELAAKHGAQVGNAEQVFGDASVKAFRHDRDGPGVGLKMETMNPGLERLVGEESGVPAGPGDDVTRPLNHLSWRASVSSPETLFARAHTVPTRWSRAPRPTS